MKSKKLLIIPILFLFAGCGNAADNYYPQKEYDDIYYEQNDDEYLTIKENDFLSPLEYPTSSFSLDSSGAAYSNIRKYINSNKLPSFDQVIIEQMVNYFDYDYQCEENSDVSLFSEISNCPWNSEAKLASIAVKTKQINYSDTSGNNYVFLIDVSGSMTSIDKLPLVKKGFSLLVDKLNDEDRVSIVTYSGREETIISGAKGKEKAKIKSAINNLYASGSTNGQGGIQEAYRLAKKYYIEGGVNQILMATDGDFNVGVSSVEKLKEMVKEELNSGISLSCFGFGMGNYKDKMMQELALNGNGNVFYIDDELEMTRIFNGDISSILQVVAKDAKIQIKFDENKVNKYRLIGYENRLMSDEEFDDENKDAGEIYSNRTTIAFYEIITNNDENDNLFATTLRYKDVNDNSSKEIIKENINYTLNPSENHIFGSLVVEFGLLLRNSEYKGSSSYENIINTYNEHENFKEDNLKREFYDLICKAQRLSDK